MTEIPRAIDYDDDTSRLCERAALALLKCAGPWWERIFLAAGWCPGPIVHSLHIAYRVGEMGYMPWAICALD